MVIREEMRAGFAKIEARLEASVAANVELREYIEFVSERQARETRGYFDIVAEGLRDDIRKVAEAQAATTGRIDRLEQKVDGGFADVRRDIAALAQALQKRSRPRRH